MSSVLVESTEALSPGTPLVGQVCEDYNTENMSLWGWGGEWFNDLATHWGWLCEEISDDVIDDYCDRAIDRLAEQFKEDEVFKKLICVITDEVQEIEYVLRDLKILRNLSTAFGAQLDVIGELVGESRQGKNDVDYREAIRVRIIVNNSNGEPEVLIEYARFLTQATQVIFINIYPARALIQVDGINASTEVRKKLELAALAGVALELTSSLGKGPIFRVADEPGRTPVPNSAGFAEKGVPNTGGFLVEKF